MSFEMRFRDDFDALAFPKPRRTRDDRFLEFVRSMRCSIHPLGCPAMSGPVDPHHIVTRGAGGSDHYTIPMCRAMHDTLHSIGLEEFEDRFCVDLWKISAETLSAYLINVYLEFGRIMKGGE